MKLKENKNLRKSPKDFYENNLHIGEWTEYTVNEDADDGLKDITSEEMLRICEKELNYSTVMCDHKQEAS